MNSENFLKEKVKEFDEAIQRQDFRRVYEITGMVESVILSEPEKPTEASHAKADLFD